MASASGSSVRMCDSPSRLAVSGDGSVSVKLLTPTTFVSPDSMRRTRSVLDCTSRPLISSIIPNAPPPSSTHCSSSQAAVHSSSTFASMTFEPSKMSPYSSRSDSYASTCCIRSDHCWSQERGSPSASFQHGSCRARARASRERVTPSISNTMRCTLFSGCASVSPSEFTCTPYRNRRSFSSSTP